MSLLGLGGVIARNTPFSLASTITFAAGSATALLSESNKRVQHVAYNFYSFGSSAAFTSGKRYIELDVISFSAGGIGLIGIADQSTSLTDNVSLPHPMCGITATPSLAQYGSFGATVGTTPSFGAITAGDILQIFIDQDNKRLHFGRNNTISGDPSAGTNPAYSAWAHSGVRLVTAAFGKSGGNEAAFDTNEPDFRIRPALAYPPPATWSY